MNHLTLFSLVALAVLTGCTAKMKLSSSLTQSGIVATRDIPLGQVYFWPKGSSVLREIDIVQHRVGFFQTDDPRSLRTKFTSGAEFVGGVSLSETEKADLSAEVAQRSSLIRTNTVVEGWRSPRNAIVDAINGDPRWLSSLETDIEYRNDRYIVFVSRIITGDELSLSIDDSGGASGSYKSSTVSKGGGALEFKIIDQGSLEIKKQGVDRVALFYTMSVFEMTEGPSGPRFRTVTDDVLLDLAAALRSGK